MAKTKMEDTSKLLVILGGILGLVMGIVFLVSGLASTLNWLAFGAPLSNIPVVSPVLLIVFSIVALATSGAVKISALKMEYNFVVLLIVGILMYLFGGGLGGILVIVGAILLLFK